MVTGGLDLCEDAVSLGIARGKASQPCGSQCGYLSGGTRTARSLVV
jgi:hypothetical protein